MNKFIHNILIVFLSLGLLLSCLFCVACNTDEQLPLVGVYVDGRYEGIIEYSDEAQLDEFIGVGRVSQGWYYDIDCLSDKVDFNEDLDGKNIYTLTKVKVLEVIFVVDGVEVDRQSIIYGDRVNPNYTAPQDIMLDGWYDESGEIFDLENGVVADIVLTAYLRSEFIIATFYDYNNEPFLSFKAVSEEKVTFPDVLSVPSRTPFHILKNWRKENVEQGIDYFAEYEYISTDEDLFEYEAVGDSWYLNKVKTDVELPSTVALPSVYQGKQVIGISDKVGIGIFGGAVTSLYVPQSYTYIGEYAFAFSKLVSVDLFDSKVERVGSYTFYGCNQLNRIDFPQTLKTIDKYAFYGCGGIRRLEFPEGLTEIGEYAFASDFLPGRVVYSSALEEVTFPLSLEFIGDYAFKSIGWYINENDQLPVYGGTKLIFNENNKLTRIGIGAFAGAALFEVNIKEGINDLTICDNAFAANTEFGNLVYPQMGFDRWPWSYLSSISIPSNVVLIGDYAFLGANQTIERQNDIFYQGIAAVSFTLPKNNSLKSVGDYAFADVRLIGTEFNCPALESVGDYAFYGHTFVNLILPNLIYAGDYAFYSSEPTFVSLLRIPNLESAGDYSFYGFSNVVSLVEPNALKNVGDYAFAYLNIRELDLSSVLTLGSGAFMCAKILESVILNGVIEIPAKLFENCVSLSSVRMDDNVQSIGERAFANCMSLTEIQFSAATQKIGSGAFASSGLVSVTLPIDIKKIEKHTFYGCEFLQTIVWNKNLETIEDNAFFGCSLLTELDLSATAVKRIGKYAFYDCIAITEIKLADTVSTIEMGAFKNTLSLRRLYLSNSLKTVGSIAFMNAGNESGIERIYIPNMMGAVNFALDCFTVTSIQAFVVDYENSFYKADLGCLLSFDLTKLYYYAGRSTEFILQQSVLSILPGAFSNAGNLNSVVLSSHLEEICDDAFNNKHKKSAIKEIDFSAATRLKRIGKGAFAFLGLTSADLSGCIVLENIDNYAFVGTSLSSIDFTKVRMLKRIGDWAFANEGIYGGVSFSSTLKVESINLNASGLEEIGDNAFYKNASLMRIILPYTLLKIGNCAFQSAGIESVIFESGSQLTTLGKAAFASCEKLTRFMIPSNVSAIEGADDRYAGTFSGCLSLASVSLPEGLLSIGREAFVNTSLREITLPSSLLSLGAGAFSECKQLEKVTIGAGLEFLSFGAFRNCTVLGEVVFAEKAKIKRIESYAFFGTDIKKIELPSSCGFFGEYSFASCLQLKEIRILNAVSPIIFEKTTFSSCERLFRITVAKALLDDYRVKYTSGYERVNAQIFFGDSTIIPSDNYNEPVDPTIPPKPPDVPDIPVIN